MLNSIVSRLSRLHSRKGLYPFLRTQLEVVPVGARVLSVGSGGGIGKTLRAAAEERGFQLLELDVDEAREPDLIGDIHDFGSDEKFDVVVLCEVLEHLYNPWQAIENIHRLLHPNGTLVVTVPFIFPIHDEPVDYYRFTCYGLQKLLEGKFKVDVLERANSSLEAVCVLLYRLHTESSVGARLFGVLSVLLSPLIYVVIRYGLFFVDSDRLTTRYHVVATRIDEIQR